MRSLFTVLVAFWILAGAVQPVAQAQFTGFGEARPFVVGVIPVVGPSGAVGGVSIDANGVLSRAATDIGGRVREARLRALAPRDSDLAVKSPLRKISLRRLTSAIDKQRLEKQPIDEAMQCLAGLTRIEFVFA